MLNGAAVRLPRLAVLSLVPCRVPSAHVDDSRGTRAVLVYTGHDLLVSSLRRVTCGPDVCDTAKTPQAERDALAGKVKAALVASSASLLPAARIESVVLYAAASRRRAQPSTLARIIIDVGEMPCATQAQALVAINGAILGKHLAVMLPAPATTPPPPEQSGSGGRFLSEDMPSQQSGSGEGGAAGGQGDHDKLRVGPTPLELDGEACTTPAPRVTTTAVAATTTVGNAAAAEDGGFVEENPLVLAVLLVLVCLLSSLLVYTFVRRSSRGVDMSAEAVTTCTTPPPSGPQPVACAPCTRLHVPHVTPHGRPAACRHGCCLGRFVTASAR